MFNKTDNNHKFIATTRGKDLDIAKIRHFIAYYKHLSVTVNIQILKAHSNVVHLCKHPGQPLPVNLI